MSTRQTYRATVKVIRCSKDERLALGHTLDLVRPLARNLDGCLDRFGSGIHGQNHVVAENMANLLRPFGKDIIVKSARRQRQTLGLLAQGLHQLGVTVTLVNGRVGRQTVNVLSTLGIPDSGALCSRKDNRQRMVIVGSEFMFGMDSGLGGAGVIAGIRQSGDGLKGGRGGLERAFGSHVVCDVAAAGECWQCMSIYDED